MQPTTATPARQIEERRPTAPGWRAPPVPAEVDREALERDLRQRVRGEVRFSEGDRALYATDGSNYRQVPIGVVIPEDAEDVVEAVAVCREHGAPILGRGGGTSLAGQCCNVAVVFDFSKKMNRILHLDPKAKTAVVEPGLVLDRLREAAEKHQLTFAPDPATHNRCTLGGMIGNNSCGSHSMMAGRTADNVLELEVLTYDGQRFWVGPTDEDELEDIIQGGGRRGGIYATLREIRDEHEARIREKYPDIPRRVSGYNLDALLPENGFQVARALVGTESTCVMVLQAKLQLVHSPPERALVLLGYPDIGDAGDEVPAIARHEPCALECFDETLTRDMRRKHMHLEKMEMLPEANAHAWLLVELGADSRDELERMVQDFVGDLEERGVATAHRVYIEPAERERVLKVRESGVGSSFRVPGIGNMPAGWEDSAVPPEKVGDYLRELRSLAARHGYDHVYYGHIGQGCVHTRFNFSFKTAEEVKRYRAFMEDAVDLVLRYGGSLSGEHGDGQARAEFLPRMYGEELVGAFRRFKLAWDPRNRMNPGKLVDPYPTDTNLRWGPSYRTWESETKLHFHYPEDNGRFSLATERCVGVGKCRKTESGTMCPSYMVTKEEMHSTRGRAHLLNEMMRGSPVDERWRSEDVKESLDLCLACKGCKGECPVDVDVATYKAEFMAHHYKGRLRPRPAYALGLAHVWSRVGALAPGIANLATQTPALAKLGKRLAGVAPDRTIPRFAPQTFRDWYEERGGPRAQGDRVILWTDTFTNHYHTNIAKAAVEVLEHAGFRVEMPKRNLCCGRPLYDYGFLDMARWQLEQILASMEDDIEMGTPVIGLEPSCTSVFRDELPNLLNKNEDAHRLAQQTFTLGEFLQKRAPDYEPPHLDRQAIVHGHCHHKSVLSMSGEEEILNKMGLDYRMLDSGCCGLAGSFGYEEEKYDVSMAVGERVLLPAAREAGAGTLVVTDGFSCREQIQHGAGREALHLAEVLQMGLRENGARRGLRR